MESISSPNLTQLPSKLFYLLGGCLVLYAITSFIASTFSPRARFLRRQKWARKHSGWFSSFHDRIESIKGTRGLIQDAYTQYSVDNKPFALPQFGSGPVIVLPPAKMKTVLQKPDEELNLHVVLRDMLAADYTGDQDIGADPFHLDIARQELTRKLPALTADVYSELLLGFEDQWGEKSDTWTEVSVSQSCRNIVSRAANRVFSGKVLCRNPEFLHHTQLYARRIFEEAGLLSLLPSVLRRVVGPLIARKNREQVRVCEKYAGPLIEERIAAVQAGNKDPPNDALQWLIERCINKAKSNPEELTINRITRRLMRLNMVAIHTTTITITNTLMDLYTCPRSEEFLAGLREECHTVLATHGGQWTKAAVNDLYRIDSAIKESMRLSSLQIHGVFRQVMSDGGVDLGDGIHIPQGVRLAMPNAVIHRDPIFYPHPDEYDAFRFSRSREKFHQHGRVLEKRNLGLVTTSDTFLGFGHGRHACPGRFFASQELKLMLAVMVMGYDVRFEGARPENLEFKGSVVPDPRVKMFVRLR